MPRAGPCRERVLASNALPASDALRAWNALNSSAIAFLGVVLDSSNDDDDDDDNYDGGIMMELWWNYNGIIME